jgi:hypothetical protein
MQVEDFDATVRIIDTVVPAHLERMKADVLTAYEFMSCQVGHFVNPTIASWYLDVTTAPDRDAASATVTATHKAEKVIVSCNVWFEQDDVWDLTEVFATLDASERQRLEALLDEFSKVSPGMLLTTVARLSAGSAPGSRR